MPKDHSPLLDSLVDPHQAPAPGRVNFATALHRLDLHSVFDIIRLSRSEFIEQLARHCDDDGGLAYDNATGYATQIELLGRARQAGADSPRSKRDATPSAPAGPTWSALFKDDWNGFCSTSSLAALDSPAAYLRALYLFALQVEQSGKGTQAKITLAQRRPSLKDLVISAENTTRQLPLLTLVNETLKEAVETCLANNRDLYANKSIQQVLAETRYPFQLPFDLAHQQCMLGLSGKKPGLGTLNYRISLKLPHSQQPENKYGTVQQEAYVAQRLLTRLSPGQQNLLTDNLFGLDPALDPAPAVFFKRHYGHPLPITDVQQFMRHTGLTIAQLHELLALGINSPLRSANAVHKTAAEPGARYINGPALKGQQSLGLSSNPATALHMLHTTPARHDRLQRMIRLQRWLGLPFAELDTLLYSSMACEPGATAHLLINDNCLRALGVYRYLQQRYGLQPSMFAAWLHRLPVYGTGQQPALFDQVFNGPHLSGPPLQLDNSALDLAATDSATQGTLYRVCAALGLEDTPESLGLLKTRTPMAIASPARDVSTLSSFYRQATLPGVFGLSISECDQLVQLLGGDIYRQQLLNPGLRASGSNAPADFLDVLMQLDWAVTWLKDSGLGVQQLRRQLLLDGTPRPAPVQQRFKQIEAVFNSLHGHALPQSDLDALNLPQPEDGLNPLTVSWGMILIKGILKSHTQLPRQPKLDGLEKGLAQSVDRHVTLSLDATRNQTLKDSAKQQLTPLLQAAYTRLIPWRGEVEQLLRETSQASEAPELFKHSCKQAVRIFANALGSDSIQDSLKHLLLFLPDAEANLQLPLNRTALQAFLFNPHWLDAEHSAGSTLRLTLSTLYLLQAFSYFGHVYGADQDRMLNYLRLANPQNPLDDLSSLAAQCHEQLALLLGWSSSEIEALTRHLPHRRARSMAELDWLRRCHETARATGLSAGRLLMATGLTATFSSDDWTQVSQAILATHA